MKIKNRLYMSAGISIVLVVILVSLVFVTSGRIAEENEKHLLLMNVYESVSELDIVTYDYLLHRKERMEYQWNIKHGSLGKILDELAKEERLKSIRADYATLGNLFSQITAHYEERQKYIREGASQKKIDAITGLEERLVAQLLITSHSIITDASRLAEEAHTKATEAQRVASNLTVILMIVLAIAITTSSLIIARSISKPLYELTKGVEIIGKGGLEHKVEVKSKDEFGQLAAAFNKMTESLKKVTASRDELDREVTVRKRAEEQLLKSNVELTAVNDELEAFSYSVSHDLRAPLRGIDGFSQRLLTKYTDEFDEKGRHYLERVRAGCLRMGQLIDDLLQLSRVTRSKMKHENVDLSIIAHKIALELKESKLKREVEFVIEDGLRTRGDTHLLRQVLENLLGYAWKYTSKNASAKIEFSTVEHNGKQAFFVRDNGVGFEMNYVDKLFGAFQRLHLESEFPGTGIGLATVKRIIFRHGGEVWAEGEVGKGATFYFAL